MPECKTNKEWREKLRVKYGNNSVKINKPKKGHLEAVVDGQVVGYWDGKTGKIN